MNEMGSENVNQDELPEYPFRFPVEVPTLQNMASHRFCLATFCHLYRITFERRPNDFFCNPFEPEPFDSDESLKLQSSVHKLLEGLQLPRSIEKILERDSNKIYCESRKWASYINKDLCQYWTFEIGKVNLDFNWCTWQPNGELDHRKSMAKMLNSGRLNERQKFVLASTNCMGVQILKTISSDTIRYFSEKVRFDNEPFLFYWLCYAKNELQRVPLDEGSTLESTMAKRCYQYEPSDLEYFWPWLTNDRRISLAKGFLRRGYDWYWFSSVDRLFFSISSDSSASFVHLSALYLKYSLKHSGGSMESLPSHQLIVWNRFKNQITGPLFADLFKVFKKNMHIEDKMQMLVHIWDTAYNHQIEYLVQYGVDKIISRFADFVDSDERSICPSAYHIIGRIISQKPKAERMELLEKCMGNFIDKIKRLELLDEMLNLCLPSSHDQLLFKATLSNSKKLRDACVVLLKQGEFSDVVHTLEWLFSDDCSPNTIAKFKSTFISLEEVQDLCLELLKRGKYTELDCTLEWLLSDHSRNAIVEFKSTLSSSEKVQDALVLLKRGEFADLGRTLEWLFSDNLSPNTISKLKSTFLSLEEVQNLCMELLKQGKYTDLDRALEWLFSDCSSNAIVEFKSTFVSSKELQNLCLELLKQGKYTEFDRILEWLFSGRNSHAIAEFKSTLLSLEKVQDALVLLKLGKFADVGPTLEWFCDDRSPNAIAELKSKSLSWKELENLCVELSKRGKYTELDRTLEWLFSDRGGSNAIAQFKSKLSSSEEVQDACVVLLKQGEFTDLNRMLDWMFSGNRSRNAIAELKSKFLSSKRVQDKCMVLLKRGDTPN